MHIRLRHPDPAGKLRYYAIKVDPVNPPTLIHPTDDLGPDICLQWHQALNDQGQLRQCPLCGNDEFYVAKNIPQITLFVILVLAAAITMALLGMHQVTAAVIALAALLLVDLLVLALGGQKQVCYRCRSEFRQLPIRKGHPGWNPATAEKYAGQSQSRG